MTIDRARQSPAASRIGRARVISCSLLLIGFAAVVLAATLTPEPLDQGLRPAIDQILDALHRRGLPGWFGYSALEFSANVAMFVPLAFLIAMLLPYRFWWWTLLIGPAMSIAIELVQAIAFSARFASAGDVIANSTGAFIGAGLAFTLRTVVRRLERETVVAALRQAQRPSS